MYILAIDTSTSILGVAILRDEQVIGEFTTNIAKNQTPRLMPAIDFLMNEVELSPDQLNKIIVAKGPGSYTGVRVGLTTAKSLAWALDIPIVGVSSLQSLAYQGRFFSAYICPFFDARRETVFTGLYKWEKNQLVQVIEDSNILMKDWLEMIKEYEQEIMFLSPHIEQFQQQIVDEIEEFAIIPEGPFHLPKPAHLAMVGLNQSPDPVHSLVPNYLRLAEAEANWLKAQGKKKK